MVRSGYTLGFAMHYNFNNELKDDNADNVDGGGVGREFRALVIDIVLATDMSFHFQQIKNMRNLLSMPEK